MFSEYGVRTCRPLPSISISLNYIGFIDIIQSTTEVWYQSLIPGTPPQISTGPNGLQRFDYVVQSAEAHGIKLIINFVNNWSDYGRIPA
jgi:mannan endo-1,4-beta-mannosidase